MPTKTISTRIKKTTNPTKSNNNLKGKIGEDKACAWLESRGFMILERNFHTRFGEIDIIALEGVKKDFSLKSHSTQHSAENTLNQHIILHFIEVKNYTRSLPIYAITPKKLAKIYQSIEVYFFTQNQQNTQPNPQITNIIQIANQNICIKALPYCVSAMLIQGSNFEKISFLPNISPNVSKDTF